MVRKITLHVKPGSKRPGIEKTTEGEWTVRVSSPPVDGKANEAAVELIAEELGLRRSQIRIVAGLKGRKKIVEISG